jgi:spore coat protein U-like protein
MSISIALNRGGSATFTPRRMIKGADTLNYNLYLDASGSTIFGTMPARQNAKVGSYTDAITATINF